MIINTFIPWNFSLSLNILPGSKHLVILKHGINLEQEEEMC